MAFLRLSSLHSRERRLVETLRAADGDHSRCCTAPTRAALHNLAAAASKRGYGIRKAGTAYLSHDEIRLLGWLALCQRAPGGAPIRHDPRHDPARHDPALEEPLRDAAAALTPGFLLPYQAVLRAGFINDPPARFE